MLNFDFRIFVDKVKISYRLFELVLKDELENIKWRSRRREFLVEKKGMNYFFFKDGVMYFY